MSTSQSKANNSSAGDDYEDPRLIAAMQEYVAAMEAGHPPTRREMLAKHPEIARELSDCLSGLKLLRAGAPAIQSVDDETRAAANALPNNDPDLSDARPLGDFRLIREIGRGGMGVVYEAMQLSLGRRVAVKVLSMAAALDGRQLQRFRNEAQAAAQLHHTNIVPVYAVGCERSVNFYAMQLIEGRSLAELIAQMRKARQAADDLANRPTEAGGKTAPFSRTLEVEPSTSPRSAWPSLGKVRGVSAADAIATSISLADLRDRRRQSYFRTVAQLGVQVCEALDYAHRAGVIHRDIKPANLLLDDLGTLWITDFGLAQLQTDHQLTQAGETVGTLQYMSPEQASGRAVLLDQRTDIYSLGVTLYELLTLERAYTGTTRDQLLHQIQHQDARPARTIDRTIPPELETILTTAMAKEPSERYSTARALAEDLQRYLRDEPIRARKPSLRSRMIKWGRRHRALVAGTVVVSILAAAGSIVAAVLIAAEQTKTQQAYERERERLVEANRQRQLAEKSFAQARDAVNYLSRVAADDLADVPQATAVRREMLEAALDYNQGFLEDHGSNAAVSNQLAEAEANVATILAELAAFDDLDRVQSRLRLVSDPAVRTELAATDQQVDRIRQLSYGFPQKMREAFARVVAPEDGSESESPGKPRDMWNLSPTQRREALSSLALDLEKQLAAILSATQVERLSQISRQIRGPIAFGDPDVATPLSLSREQRELVRRVQSEARRAQREAQHGVPPWDRRPEINEQTRQIRQNAIEQIVAGLSADQKSKWQTLKGAAFTAPVLQDFGQRGPRRSPNGPGRPDGGRPDGGRPDGPGHSPDNGGPMQRSRPGEPSMKENPLLERPRDGHDPRENGRQPRDDRDPRERNKPDHPRDRQSNSAL